MKEKISRKEFLKMAAIGGLSLPGMSFLKSTSLSPGAKALIENVGVQLYTVRDILAKSPEATLKVIAEIGYKQLETVGVDILQKHGQYIRDLGMTVSSAHIPFESILDEKKSPMSFQEIVKIAHEHGLSYLVFPYVPDSSRGGVKAFQELAMKLNSAGSTARNAGITFCYHNHAFDFQPIGHTTPIQIILENTDPILLKLETDVFWVSVAGVDPVDFIRKHKNRVELLHLKDKKAGLRRRYNENVPHNAFKALGKGTLDFRAIIETGADIGVRHCYVEQDYTPGNPLISLRESYRYLQSLKA